MGPVDRQQLLGGGNDGLRVALLMQQRLRQLARTVPHPLALGRQPGVEAGIKAVKILEQIAVKQRQRCRFGRRRTEYLLDVDPNGARAQRKMVPVDVQYLRADRMSRFQQAVDFLP